MRFRIQRALRHGRLQAFDAWHAYFTGFGKAKRIVFFDTLLQNHTPDEILSILAHELGHYKLGHIGQRIARWRCSLFWIRSPLLGIRGGFGRLLRPHSRPRLGIDHHPDRAGTRLTPAFAVHELSVAPCRISSRRFREGDGRPRTHDQCLDEARAG